MKNTKHPVYICFYLPLLCGMCFSSYLKYAGTLATINSPKPPAETVIPWEKWVKIWEIKIPMKVNSLNQNFLTEVSCMLVLQLTQCIIMKEIEKFKNNYKVLQGSGWPKFGMGHFENFSWFWKVRIISAYSLPL